MHTFYIENFTNLSLKEFQNLQYCFQVGKLNIIHPLKYFPVKPQHSIKKNHSVNAEEHK